MNYNRISQYEEVWNKFNFKYSIKQVAKVIEIIEATSEPEEDELGYEIWQEWLEVINTESDSTKLCNENLSEDERERMYKLVDNMPRYFFTDDEQFLDKMIELGELAKKAKGDLSPKGLEE